MIEFHIAKQSDIHRIVQTYNESIPGRLATADLEQVSVESKQKWFDDHNENTRPLWIILYNGIYSGWLSFTSFYGRPAYNETVEVSIYLESCFHKKGIGKSALQFSENEAKKRKIKTLLGFIFGHNEASIKLFQKAGFVKWAHLPEVANMEGTLRDLIILGKKI
jgi:L-amino acid N-acyltransferase YncA